MKKVLYLSNIEVPYRVRFFNALAQKCSLTVLYEREQAASRDPAWAKSREKHYRVKYLRGIPLGGENAFSLGILKALFSDYDCIIIGCCNSPVQLLAMLVLRLFRMPFFLNLDGEPFLAGSGLKAGCKRFLLSGAACYLTAGEKAAQSLRDALGAQRIVPYWFGSLSERELALHRQAADSCKRTDTVLVVGQYLDCKGLDVALEAARRDASVPYRFVGMGRRTEQFQKDHQGRIPENVELIPFLEKQELEREYRKCAMLVLPSRQECWGLVIGEAASYGTPIVSTWGSGAAVEYLGNAYPQFLAEPGSPESLYDCICALRRWKDKDGYGNYLREISARYSIEASVQAHLRACGIISGE